ncbi:hypothetical protein BDF19DRAFT_433349 [Syncephalis fuscata]|nr:hypothetical protein BDF19DRAFT_433349 [Syncephalis fuscata]
MTQSWIQTDPSGEITSLAYLWEADDDIDELKNRFIGQWKQIIINTVLLYLFAMNTRKAIRLVLTARRPLTPALCLVQAAAGVILGVVSLLTVIVPIGITCRMVIWICALGMVISSLCVDTILLNKAYKFSFIYIVVRHTVSRQSPADGCFVEYPFYYPWQRLALDLPVNAIFSISFLIVIIEQYKKFGSNAWAQISEDGLLFLAAAAFSNIATALIGVFHVLGTFQNGCLLSIVKRARNILAMGNRPRTFIQNANLNAIQTDKSSLYHPQYQWGSPEGMTNYSEVAQEYPEDYPAHLRGEEMSERALDSQHNISGQSRSDGQKESYYSYYNEQSQYSTYISGHWNQADADWHTNYRPTRLLDFIVR